MRWASVLVSVCPLALAGCSLLFPFDTGGETGSDSGMRDGAPPGEAGPDAGRQDAGSDADAGMGFVYEDAILAGGLGHTCVLSGGAVRELFCWGNGEEFQNGNVDELDVGTPTRVELVSPITIVDLRAHHNNTCVVDNLDRAHCWGRNSAGQTGVTRVTHPSFVRAMEASVLAGFRRVELGASFACGINTEDQVRCWGSDVSGQIGEGTVGVRTLSTQHSIGTPILPPGDVVDLAVGDAHACAIIEDSVSARLYCWGINNLGSIGIGTTVTPQPDPQLVGLPGRPTRLFAGGTRTCALNLAEELYCWGGNVWDEIDPSGGSAITTPRRMSQVPGGTAADVAVGGQHICVLDSAGGVLCWGRGTHGQLGTGVFTTPQPNPSAPSALGTGITELVAGTRHTCVSDGSDVLCFGDDSAGQIGVGAEMYAFEPVNVFGFDDATAVGVGGRFTCAIRRTSGTVTCWGDGVSGHLGRGLLLDQSQAGAPVEREEDAGPLTGATSLAVGFEHTCAGLDSDMDGSNDEIRCWGRGTLGQLGDTARANRPRAVLWPVDTGFESGLISAGTSFSCAANTATGSVRCVGEGLLSRLGRFCADPMGCPDFPSAGPELPMIVSLDVGNSFGCASNGTSAVCWGENTSDQLGAGMPSVDDTIVPLPVLLGPGPATPVSMSSGGAHACTVMSDDEVVCWGANGQGQAGQDIVSMSTVVAPAPAFSGSISSLSAGSRHTCVVDGTGRVLCWGYNMFGQLGRVTPATPMPGQVADTLTDYIQVSAGFRHTCAVRRDGNVSCWGSDRDGRLGTGRELRVGTPTRVVAPGP